MAQVTVTVNDKSYTLACDDGEEAHLTELARQIDKRIADLKGEMRQASDAQMMLMAALTAADDLTLAQERIQELEEDLAGLKNEFLGAETKTRAPKGTFDEEKFAGLLESAARRMEDIAGRLT